MTDYLSQLKSAIEAVQIHSSTVFSWFGKRSPSLIPRIERELSPKAARNFLQYSLQARLYSHFYCTGWATPVRDDEAAHRLTGVSSYIEKLSVANSGQGSWSDGWERVGLGDLREGLVAAQRGGLLLIAGEGEYREGAEDHTLQLRFSKELPAESPGFYMAVGDLDLDTPLPAGVDAIEGGLVRFYWHLSPDGAVKLMQFGTLALNAARIPFKMKVLNDPGHFVRCDSAVLYIQRHYHVQTLDLLGDVYAELRADARNTVPAFTLELAGGLGLAEDPGGGGSFGMHRCGLIAEGLIRAYEAGGESDEVRLRFVLDCFKEAGVSIEKPYLSETGGWTPVTRLPKKTIVTTTNCGFPSPKDKPAPEDVLPPDDPKVDRDMALGTATNIAARLISDAIWHDDMCTWMGTELKVEKNGARREEWATLSSDLYTGTAGVGLFLAEYAAVTGDADARRTALGSFRQAFRKADAMTPSARPGLYTGWVGIALAAARAGLVLGETELAGLADDLMRRCASEDHPRHEHDLLAGSAGAIVGCLALRALSGQDYMLDYAVRLGEDLLASAVRAGEGALAWRTVNNKTAAPLTGFSHGTAGIGHALLELWSATADIRCREAGEAAFRYEERYFNPKIGNWPDFRETAPARSGSSDSSALPYMTYWCHGAPGIALSRLRAYALTGDKARLGEATAALHTTQNAVAVGVVGTTENYSLCHGLAGNVTVLQHGIGVVEDIPLQMFKTVANMGVTRYRHNGWWACGTNTSPSAQAPGLLLGTAGIGHFYLRLAYPDIPSVLLIEHEAWANGQIKEIL